MGWDAGRGDDAGAWKSSIPGGEQCQESAQNIKYTIDTDCLNGHGLQPSQEAAGCFLGQ